MPRFKIVVVEHKRATGEFAGKQSGCSMIVDLLNVEQIASPKRKSKSTLQHEGYTISVRQTIHVCLRDVLSESVVERKNAWSETSMLELSGEIVAPNTGVRVFVPA
jgi:hypothetical protein